MKAAEHLLNPIPASELSRLSRDPELAFRPDPAFRPNFRNPDEILETDAKSVHDNAHHLSTIPPAWRCATWRRSPKE